MKRASIRSLSPLSIVGALRAQLGSVLHLQRGICHLQRGENAVLASLGAGPWRTLPHAEGSDGRAAQGLADNLCAQSRPMTRTSELCRAWHDRRPTRHNISSCIWLYSVADVQLLWRAVHSSFLKRHKRSTPKALATTMKMKRDSGYPTMAAHQDQEEKSIFQTLTLYEALHLHVQTSRRRLNVPRELFATPP